MRFISTRSKGGESFSASEAILKGLAPEEEVSESMDAAMIGNVYRRKLLPVGL